MMTGTCWSISFKNVRVHCHGGIEGQLAVVQLEIVSRPRWAISFLNMRETDRMGAVGGPCIDYHVRSNTLKGAVQPPERTRSQY